MQQILIVTESRYQADIICREAGLAPTHHNPTVRYVFDQDQLRGIPRGFILCFAAAYYNNREAGRIYEMAVAREARIFYSLAEALQAAKEPAP